MTKGSDAAAREMGSIAKSTNAPGTGPEKKSALSHPHASKIWSARVSLRFSAVADHAFPEPQPLTFPRLLKAVVWVMMVTPAVIPGVLTITSILVGPSRSAETPN